MRRGHPAPVPSKLAASSDDADQTRDWDRRLVDSLRIFQTIDQEFSRGNWTEFGDAPPHVMETMLDWCVEDGG